MGASPIMKEQDIRSREALAHYLALVEKDIARYFADPAQFQSVSCPACEGTTHSYEFTKVGFRYVSCGACRTLFVNPRPSRESLKAFYLAAPSSRYWIDGFFRPVAEARREMIFRPRALYAAERLPALAGGTVGDVGAGFGLFLEELRKLWPQSLMVAIEPSSEMAHICRSKGLEVAPTPIEELTGCNGRFNLLTAFELLEHLHEPRMFLECAFRLLRSGGALLITTLNGLGFDIQVLWERSKSVSPPHHLNFLNPQALADLCERVGFSVEEISTPGELDWDIVESAILNDGTEAGRFLSWLARNGDVACKRDFQAWLSQHGLSSHMRVLVRKP